MKISKMKIQIASLLTVALSLMLASTTVSAAGGAHVEHSGANINDTVSLQRVAKLYLN